MILALTAAHLEEMMPSLKVVGTGLDLAAFTKSPPGSVPAAFVWPVAMAGGVNNRVNGVRQFITTSLAVTIILRRHGDAAGAKKADELDQLINTLNDILIGWSPSEKYAPFEFAAAGLDAMANGYVWWTQQYRTSHTHFA